MVDKFYDKFFKTFGKDFINAFFKYNGIDEEIVQELNSEVTTFGGELRTDFVGRSIYGYDVNVEYQSNKPTNIDIKRFGKYSHRIQDKYGNGVATYIFTLAKTSQKEIIYDWGPYNQSKFILISVSNMNAHKILNNIKMKIKANETLSNRDILFLQAGYIVDEDNLFETLIEMIDVVDEIKTLDEFNIKKIKFFYEIMSKILLNEYEQKLIMERLTMGISFYEDMFKKGVMFTAANLIKKGQTNEFISEVTDLTFDEIEELRK